ncbi:MAG: hypothetical protein LUC88_02755 [Prevotella sp.]|nr:hypothetical protein [Prevotella sp.]
MKKKIFSLATAILLFSATGMAQDQNQQKGKPDASQRIEQMISELGLDDSQAAQFKEVMSEMMSQDMGGGPRGPRGPQGPRGPRGPKGEMGENGPQDGENVAPPCACAMPNPDGNDAPQCACAQTTDDNAAPQCNCSKPTQEEMEAKKAEMEAKRAEIEAKRAEIDEKIKAILTDEQYQKFQELKSKRPERPQGPRGPKQQQETTE